jgi:hypothetical protein
MEERVRPDFRTGRGAWKVDMASQERRAAYASLWVLALAFGWIEASTVLYLREIFAREASFHAFNYLPDLQVTLMSIPGPLVALEVAREACTLVLLAAVGWLSGSRFADRVGAFLVSFGIWDLSYYGVLRLVSGWPGSINTWDILFLIPSPWVAPIWAPVTVATLFVLAGSYLFWTSDRERQYRRADIGILASSVFLTIAAFLVDTRAAMDHRVPEHFPIWLFWSGVGLGMAWFIRVERRVARTSDRRSPWPGVRVRTIVPTHVEATTHSNGRTRDEGTMSGLHEDSDASRVMAEYGDAKRRLSVLTREADELSERFERLAHGLSARPHRLIVGLPDERIANPSEWEIVPSHPLPSIEHLIGLTNEIRAVGATIESLRERLVLMGHADLVAQPDRFFR